MTAGSSVARLCAGALVLGLVVVPVALAGSGGGAAASGVKGKIKKLQEQITALQQQVNNLSQQPGPQVPAGQSGRAGSDGPLDGPAREAT